MKATVELRVLNQLGLHARPATEFVKLALRYKTTTIILIKGEQTFVTTSILEILSAELDQGTVFTLEADGPEAEPALAEFTALMVKLLEEEEADRGRSQK